MRATVMSMFLLGMVASQAFALPSQIDPPGERMILVSPTQHAWGAYNANGQLIRSGVASTGADWCKDMDSECHTDVGHFRIRSLGGAGCTSPSFPLPNGGGPMPYCMYFNSRQALHGYPHIDRVNRSHGCVRMRTEDARWLRYNFAQIGTLVVVEPYYD